MEIPQPLLQTIHRPPQTIIHQPLIRLLNTRRLTRTTAQTPTKITLAAIQQLLRSHLLRRHVERQPETAGKVLAEYV